MADMQQPKPPPGFQRPGVPGAGNILDPAVRGELREKIQEAVKGAAPQPGAAAQQDTPEERTDAPTETTTAAEPEPKPTTHRAGPFPHGDVDLRGFAANVPPGPVRPKRGKAGRRFYFLSDSPPEDAATTPPAAAQPTDVRKPG